MSEERDLEKELKEEKDRYEQQNQEAYDEVTKGNEELRRKQEQEAKEEEDTDEDPTTDKLESRGYKGNRESARQRQIRLRQRALADRDKEGSTVTRGPGQVFTGGKDTVEVPDRDMRTGQLIPNETELDQFGNPRLAASITTEIGLNLLLDIFSFAPPAQAVGSAWINYLAQKIRGEKDINKLEMTAASIASQIPLLGSFKGATKAGKFGKGVLQGAVTGAIEETGYSLGRGEEADVLGGAVFGGLVGGLFNARNAPAAFDAIKAKLNTGSSDSLNKLAVPEGTLDEFIPNTAFAMGGPGSGRKKKVDKAALEAAGQGNIFKSFAADPRLGQTDEQIMEAYKAARLRLGDPYSEPRQLPRSAAERRLVPSMFTKFLTEDPSIPQSKVQEYIDAVTDERRGRKLYNLVAGRPFARKRSNKGLTGTLIFLNDAYLSGRSGVKKLGNITMNDLTPIRARTGSPQDIADEMSAIFNRDITPDTLEDIINKQGSIPIEIGTPGTANYEVIDVVDLPTLTEAYMKRIQRYRTIPAFEAGHIFAARNILDDLDVDNVANFKGNLEPEIARSIYGITDNKVFEDLLEGVDTEQIVAGNRARGQNIDPDKTIAALYGRDYGLRESFLNFVYPERSLANKIPPDLKKEFTERYVEEMDIALRDYDGGTVGPYTLDFIRAIVLREKVMPFFNLGDEFLEGFINTANKVTKADMVSDVNVYLERNLLKPLQINVAGDAK